LILCEQLVFSVEDPCFQEVVEDAVDDVVRYQGESDQDWARVVIISKQEDRLIDQEKDHE